ncbi:IclR family transcriptional regulator [Chromobacterium sp. Beijing]|uniref:IclR family transcriptional regulator n=1 Tax=Chromobacterium sp. Beijing TaxID=2735795 RepID=UPI001F333173|nr:IclR family transcriptional regulator [Chromobacterium sp. Beijing]UJB31301.1 IclR family transcriptional regulator [Chromobacterium sp. Beijing]
MDEQNLNDAAARYTVPALERGLRLLGEFSRGEPTLSAPELARRLALPRSTVFRMLATLEQLGFIERAEGGRDYRLGIAVLRLGFEYLSSLELTELGLPVLGRLRDRIGHACSLVVRDGRSIVYVAKVNPPSWIASNINIGARLPAHATVFGRILLSELPLEKLRELYPEEHLDIHSSQTPRNTLELFHLLQQDRERSCLVGEGFFETNISTVAAPVRNHGGAIIAAIGATLPMPRLEPGQADALAGHIRAAAAELSRALGHAGGGMGKVIHL